MINALSHVILVLGLVLSFIKEGACQVSPYFNHLSIKQGLSQSIVYCAYQDKEGFMWFGTANGLNKFDGYTFQVFQPDPNDPDHSLRQNIIWDILEDRSNHLWVTTLGEGIHQLDKKTGRVTAYKTAAPNRNLCYQICIDQLGDFWIASAGGLNQFNPVTKKFILWPAPAPNDQEIRSVLEDSRGILWIGTTKGLYQLDRRARQFHPVVLNPGQPKRQDFINSLYQDATGTVWVASIDKGLYRFDYDDLTRAYHLNRQIYLSGHGVSPNGIGEEAPGLLWVGTHGKGLKQLNTHTGQVSTFVSQKDVAGSLSNNSVLSVLKIRSGTLWVGTDNGINMSSPQARKFPVFQLKVDPTFSRLIANNISTLLEDHEGIIWVGNEWFVHADGLFRLDRRRNKRILYQHQPRQAGSLLSNHVTALLEDHTGLLWVGTLDGVQSFNRAKSTFTRYPTTIKVSSIQEDKAGNLWLGGEGGIARLERRTGQLTYYWLDYSHKVNKLLTSRSGIIWVATSGEGLGRIDPVLGTYTPVQVGYGQPLTHTIGRLSDWVILSLYEDKQGIVWLGTNQGGLNQFDPHTGECRIVTTKQGLPSNNIKGILGDDAGNLWLATNRGLCRYDPVRGSCRKYDERDGLQDNEFHSAYARSPDGELLFGGPNGFNVFRPDQLHDNPVAPIVYITSLHVLDRERFLSKGQLELTHDENFLQLGFVGLSYVLSEKNQYAYQLVGIDKNWVYNGTRRFARYTDLSPGTYVFQVKAANNDGVWNTKGTSLTIIIHPPWWRTWWAYLGYGLLLIGALWKFTQIRIRSISEKREAEQLRTLDRLKTRFFTNITHELRTPLTLILAPLERLLDDLKTTSHANHC